MHQPRLVSTLTDACMHKHMYMNTHTFEDRTACPVLKCEISFIATHFKLSCSKATSSGHTNNYNT